MGVYNAVEQILQAVFPDYGKCAIFATEHNGIPNSWREFRDIAQLDGTRDCYLSSGVCPGPGTRANTIKEVWALVIDDIGTAGPPEDAVARALGLPTFEVLTSKGNAQWWYALAERVPAADWRTFFAEVERRVGSRLHGPEAGHVFRIPFGINSKTERDGKPVAVEEQNWNVILGRHDLSRRLDTAGIMLFAEPVAAPSKSACGTARNRVSVAALEKIAAALPNPEDMNRDGWSDTCHEFKALNSTEEGFGPFDTWSQKWPGGYDAADTWAMWQGIRTENIRTSGNALLPVMEKAAPKEYAELMSREGKAAFDDGVEQPNPLADGGGGHSTTHADMAADIVRAQCETLGWLSNSKGNRWAAFDPVMGRWVVEEHDRLMRSAVREEVLAARLATADDKVARRLAEAKWQGSVQALLTKHGDLMIPFERFDADLNMFGVPGGVVRLSSNGAREEVGAAVQMVSRATAVRPAPRGTHGVAWERFLKDFTMGNAELLAWWQAFCGYCLTGHTYEHMVVFLYGPGGNGKSVFLDTLAEVLGPYHERAASAVFMAQQGGKHMAMVADLAGARLVTSPDVPLGAAWDLGMLKPLTGGGTYKAQFMKENWFRFTPQFKLILAGNEKPILGTVDAAVRRRFWLVPAMHVPKTVNKQLVDVLRQEQAVILRWMIDGWELYNAGGLPPCKLIERATEEYLSEQDTFARWVGNTLNQTPGDMTRHRMSDLWASWDAFRAMEGVWKAHPYNIQNLNSKLKEAGFSVSRDNQGGYVDQISVVKSTIF